MNLTPSLQRTISSLNVSREYGLRFHVLGGRQDRKVRVLRGGLWGGVVALAFLWSPVSKAEAREISPIEEQLIIASKGNCEAIQSYDIEFECQIKQEKIPYHLENLSVGIYDCANQYHYIYTQDRFRHEYVWNLDPFGEKEKSQKGQMHEILCWNGQLYKTYSPLQRSGLVDDRFADYNTNAEDNPLYQATILFGQPTYAYLTLAFQNDDTPVTLDTRYLYNGRLTWKVALPEREERFVFDPAYDLNLVLSEFASGSIRITAYGKVNGVWVPEGYERDQYWPNREGVRERTSISICKITKINSINSDIPESAFEIDYPARSSYLDVKSGESIRVNDSVTAVSVEGLAKLVTLDAIDPPNNSTISEAEKQPARDFEKPETLRAAVAKTSDGDSERPSGSKGLLVVLVIGCGTFAFGAVYAFRKLLWR